MKIRLFFVYIVTNTHQTILYTGVTNDLARRIFEHKNKLNAGFTAKYNADKLVYFEIYDNANLAIGREKQIKGYSRLKKMELINSFNPEWNDLYKDGVIKKPEKKEIPHST